jgi:hypothetical protein
MGEGISYAAKWHIKDHVIFIININAYLTTNGNTTLSHLRGFRSIGHITFIIKT